MPITFAPWESQSIYLGLFLVWDFCVPFLGEINKWLFTSDTTLSTDQRKELHWRLAWEQWVNGHYLHEQYVSVHTAEANISVGN